MNILANVWTVSVIIVENLVKSLKSEIESGQVVFHKPIDRKINQINNDFNRPITTSLWYSHVKLF